MAARQAVRLARLEADETRLQVLRLFPRVPRAKTSPVEAAQSSFFRTLETFPSTSAAAEGGHKSGRIAPNLPRGRPPVSDQELPHQ
ncbi:hypothetical protein G6O67_005381 [Ophiocordyceps sinensis]|uniref:Uncharacterized protein n=2 Tax=Ophiocordyceps sinensis TaxID=72228 RepID=A0A8H4V653_9HYPO|nr:hypothetical protein OCS_06303 [Ophiocordyceps sinensis CO18]KAF4509075.1 hypothetical protein G6O67_005381 [Ophiocordyceps sinensis]